MINSCLKLFCQFMCAKCGPPPKITNIWFDNDLSFKYIVANVNEPIADSLLVECISRRSPLLSNGSWFYAGFAWKFLCISTNFSTPTFYKHSWSQRVGICISCVNNYIDWVTKSYLSHAPTFKRESVFVQFLTSASLPALMEIREPCII